MAIPAGTLLGRVLFRFGEKSAHVPEDLSAVTRGPDGRLWLAADERGSIEELRSVGPWHVHDVHATHPVGPALGHAEDEELDVEGLVATDDALWVVGSHSAKRKKPKGEASHAGLARLAKVEVEPARELLARIPLVRGRPVPERVATLGEGSSLLALLAEDEHLGPFVPGPGRPAIPGKDNGLDVEGLAILGDRVLVGLRGPVLRGWATVLELEVRARRDGLEIVGGRYTKHVLDLDGLGVRELQAHGDDVLVLAGPTMTLDGPQRVFRWRGGPRGRSHALVPQGPRLERLFDLPVHRGADRAEGLALASWLEEDDAVLVGYDSPRPERRPDAHGVLADVFSLPRVSRSR